MVKKHGNGEDAPVETDAGEEGLVWESGGAEELLARLKEKEKEAAENYDRYVRAVAELDNLKKRAQKEKADAIKYGNECIIKDILPFLDSLNRAIDHAGSSNDFEGFKKGLELAKEQFIGCLRKHGVEEVETEGKEFDPYVHEAMLQEESAEHDDNKIVREFEKGYTLNKRLLRPAKVSVSKRQHKHKEHVHSEHSDQN
ncbi:MAG: nucleotide exchange factor GrpE [Smithellaceae bacterium]|nr:nucleotide exchange factor GrpE [Smithellaceae bacterium]